MARNLSLNRVASFLVMASMTNGCANFRRLGKDLKFAEETVILSAQLTNASSFTNIKGFTFDWDQDGGKLISADVCDVKGMGLFGFFVKKSQHQYLGAFSDTNGDGKYDPGEPAWITSGTDGKPKPLDLQDPEERRKQGSLSSDTVIPESLIAAVPAFLNGRTREEAKFGWSIPIALGEVADLNEPRFSSKTGAAGYWDPAGYTIDDGIGIYFLEDYDPDRTPVIFVYGAAGSPQDWNTFFDKFDRTHFQLWFYEYPSGSRLAETGGALNRGIQLLQSHYGFNELDIVAHSMGGLVARHAVINNLSAGNRYIKHLVTISSPFDGMKFAASGIEHAPNVIPSWRDMVPGSDFQQEIFRTKLRGKVPYMLLYGDKPKRSLVLPPENDGTVSVASVTRKEAIEDAIKKQRFHEHHVPILSNPEVISTVDAFLRSR